MKPLPEVCLEPRKNVGDDYDSNPDYDPDRAVDVHGLQSLTDCHLVIFQIIKCISITYCKIFVIFYSHDIHKSVRVEIAFKV